MSAEPPEERLQRLDPDRAAAARRPPPGPPSAPPAGLSPRRLQLIAGALALALVIAFSISQLTAPGSGTVGIPAGRPLKLFAAPLAGTTLVGDVNLTPPCTAARHDPRALNACLLVRRGPLVLAFFVPASAACEAAVGAMQAIAPRFAPRGVQFAAVAVHTGPAAAAAAVRRHGWTIPVAYDRDGALGDSYGVVVCPLLELVGRGGTVRARLIGGRWSDPSALAAQVSALEAS